VAVVVVIMVVIVPITLVVPAMAVFIPPAVGMFPAVRAGFGQFVTPMLGFRTVPTMVFHGFVQLVICVRGTFLAFILGANSGSGSEGNDRCQRKTRQSAVHYFRFGVHFSTVFS
jgi:hypothetical protein